jgi:L,D-peptidoglycan transpeptidase YkuD (ErfK/YbiS/YcfS/YnhG family)
VSRLRVVTWGVLAVIVALAITAAVRDDGASAAGSLDPSRIARSLVKDAEQLVVVSNRNARSTNATVDVYERSGQSWVHVFGPWRAKIGRRGFRVDRHEGDGTTPAGSFALSSAFGLDPESSSGTRLPYTQVRSGDCWISDSRRSDYNTYVRGRVPCGSRNEDLFAIARSGPYAKAIVTNFNFLPDFKRGRGSAIFLHIHSRRGGINRPTSGCVSLTASEIGSLFTWLDPAKNPRIVMGTEQWLQVPWERKRVGSSGDSVARIQTRLAELGYYRSAISGVYGTRTAAAVRAFQRANGLAVDGAVGTRTAAALGLLVI